MNTPNYLIALLNQKIQVLEQRRIALAQRSDELAEEQFLNNEFLNLMGEIVEIVYAKQRLTEQMQSTMYTYNININDLSKIITKENLCTRD